jgi:hypothetical protein
MLFPMLLLSGCDSSPSEPVTDPDVLANRTEIRYGISFGMCAGHTGHCLQEMAVTKDQARLTLRSSEPQRFPQVEKQRSIPSTTWLDLERAVADSNIGELDAVYGCPDCADGGAEWVEVVSRGSTKRVTFEFGDPPPDLRRVLEKLRIIRATLDL